MFIVMSSTGFMRRLRRSRWLVALAVALYAASSRAQGDTPLPKLEEMALPTPARLLTEPPRDWLVLEENEVVIVEPVFPRPQFMEARQQEIASKELDRVGLVGAALETWREERDDLDYLYVIVPDGDANPEYRISLDRVLEIIYHEDLVLQQVDALVAAGDLNTALELLLRVEQPFPEWPGLDTRHNAILMLDLRQRMEAAEYESALVVADELFRIQPDYPELIDNMGLAIERLVTSAVESGDLKQAHYFLFRLDSAYPEHPVYERFAAQFANSAQGQVAAANAARAAGRHDEAATLIEEAVRIWPRLDGLQSAHSLLTTRYQRLHVGVVGMSSDLDAYPPPTRAELREQALTEISLFETDRLDGNTIFYRTRFFDEWIPLDLGRRVQFQLRQVRQPWEFQPILDSRTVAQEIIDRITPGHAKYDERLASYIEGVSVESPIQFTVRFRRVPARLEPLLRWAVHAPEATTGFGDGSTDPASEAGETTELVELAPPNPLVDPLPGRGGFVVAEATGEITRFVRDFPEPDGLRQYHVAEVVEHRYPDYERLVQGLLEGEVSLVPYLPDWIYRRLAESDAFNTAFFHEQYALPTTHLLMFNPESKTVRLRELRRALAYALDRQKILSQTVLRDENMVHGRIISGPFFTRSYANSVVVEPWPYDMSSALALSFASARQLNDEIPVLKMLTPPGLIEQAAAAEMIKTWQLIGINVEIVEPTATDATEWDILYQTVQLTEPIVDLWPFVSQQPTAELADLDHFPDWLKREFISLDRMSDWNLAVGQTQSLHRQLTSEAVFIPLWEVDEFTIYRKNLDGVPSEPVNCYDRIDRWTMDAFLPAWQPE